MMSESTGPDDRREQGRGGDSGSPVGSPFSVVVSLIAVLAGFLALRSIDENDASGSRNEGGSTTVPGSSSTVAGVSTTAAAATATEPLRVTEGATVVVANAASASGVAAAMSAELESVGYTMAEPTNSTGENLATTVVYFTDATAQIRSVAESVAGDLGGVEIEPMPTTIPVEDGGSIGTATILVMLGDDLAGDTLSEIADRAEPNVQAPTPSGTTSTT
jgi:LytR cell envelope-related transcriptional attenuator